VTEEETARANLMQSEQAKMGLVLLKDALMLLHFQCVPPRNGQSSGTYFIGHLKQRSPIVRFITVIEFSVDVVQHTSVTVMHVYRI
jgi:hypothetical protein